MTTTSQTSAPALALPETKGALVQWLVGILKGLLAATAPEPPALSARQQYDIGMTDLRPIEDIPIQQTLDAYPRSLAAELSRSI